LPSPTPRQGNLSDSSTVPAGRESGVISVNEAAATQTLDQIRTFQAQYAAKNRGKFASFNELIRSVGLDIKFAGDHPVVNGYVFKMTVEDSADTKLAAYYKLTAEPLVNTGVTATGKRYFYTDSSISTIKVSQDGPATAHSPSL
jgi:hypothetical protein